MGFCFGEEGGVSQISKVELIRVSAFGLLPFPCGAFAAVPEDNLWWVSVWWGIFLGGVRKGEFVMLSLMGVKVLSSSSDSWVSCCDATSVVGA